MQLIKKYGLLAFGVVLFLFLWLFPPIYFFEFYPYGVCGYAGFILGFAIPVGIRRAFFPVGQKSKWGKSIYTVLFIFTISFSMIFMGLFTALWCQYKTHMLFKTEGILVRDALIRNGSEMDRETRSTTSDNYEIELTYQLKNGQKHDTRTTIEADIFYHIFKDQKVDILYLPDYPDVVRLMVRDNVITYLNRPNSRILATDIDRIFKSRDTELLKILNEIGYRWHTEIEDGITVYENHITLEKVAKVAGGLVYIRFGKTYGQEYLKPLKIIGKPEETEEQAEFYLTEKYRVGLKRLHEKGNTYTLFFFTKRNQSDSRAIPEIYL
ncbi:hypothetical protein [Emticicia fontis]